MVELRSASILLAFFLVFIAVAGSFLILFIKNSSFGESKKSCFVDDDCVPAQCCHPTDVVNRLYAPDCKDVICTTVCKGPIDCGKGRPACINEKCVIVPLQ